MAIDPALLSSASALAGALVGGCASFAAAVYTQRAQDRLQRIAQEIARRETVYAEFIMNASTLFVRAATHDGLSLDAEAQRLNGLASRMRLFAPAVVVAAAETVMHALVEISLQPRIDPEEFARQAFRQDPERDALRRFSQICRDDLDAIRRIMA